MAKFKKKTKSDPEIPTSALPDIIFMLLFFFMVVTVLRETDLLVKNAVPNASQLDKIKKKTLVSYIYIGAPKDEYISKYGKEPRIQVNDVIIEPREIPLFVAQEKANMIESERNKIIMSLKVDVDAKMGIVTDVKEELKKAQALKINYSSKPKAII